MEPGQSVEANHLLLPVRLDEAALALEDVVPMVVNACAAVGTCSAIVSIVVAVIALK